MEKTNTKLQTEINKRQNYRLTTNDKKNCMEVTEKINLFIIICHHWVQMFKC